MPTVPRHLHLSKCFQEGMLEFDSPIGQCFSRFRTVSERNREEVVRERKVRDRKRQNSGVASPISIRIHLNTVY